MRFDYVNDLNKEKLFLWLIKVEEIGHSFLSIKAKTRLLVSLLLSTLIKQRKFEMFLEHKNSQLLLINTEIISRPDSMRMLDDLGNQLGELKYDFIKTRKTIAFDIKRAIYNFLFLFSAPHKYKKYANNIVELLLIEKNIIELTDLKDDFFRICDFKKYKLAILRYDAQISDNFFSQILKSVGIKTATLQHGVMIAKREEYSRNYFDYAGIEFDGFVSDYFLAWNEFTKQEALKSGIKESDIFVVGNIKAINCKPVASRDNDYFGVVLDGINNEENNVPMIKLCNQISDKIKKNYIIRYHPNFKQTEYNSIIDSNASVCPPQQTLESFLNNIEFCILSNSTVLFELPYYNMPYYRYTDGTAKDKFKDMKEQSFNSLDSFLTLYNQKCQTISTCPINKYKETIEHLLFI